MRLVVAKVVMVRRVPVVDMARFRGMVSANTEEQQMVLESEEPIILAALQVIAEADGWQLSAK